MLIKSKALIVKSWQEFIKNWSKFIMIYLYGLLGCLPLMALIVLIALTGRYSYWSNLQIGMQALLVIFFVACFIAAVLCAVYYGVRSKAATLLLIKNNYTPSLDNFKESKKYFWGFLGVSLLSFVVILAWGFVLLVPAIIFGTYYGFASYVLIAEEKRSFSSMERSYDLVHGYWWPVFGRLLLVGLLGGLAFYIMSLPLSFMVISSWPFNIYSTFINMIWVALSPFFVVYYVNIYHSLKAVNIK